MSALQRVRELFDAPRFCPDDGEPIEVVNKPRYDSRTGEQRDSWYWMCPKVYVDHEGGRITWSQQGANGVHVHGQGRPRWDRAIAIAEQEAEA